ncbi:MAG: DinB family protein [Terracidiphilus sp.]
MTELEQLICGDGAAAPPAFILERLTAEQAHQAIPGSPRTIYQELWHITFWQQISLDWIAGVETPFPAHAEQGFPSEADAAHESWQALCERFFYGNQQAVVAAQNLASLERPIRCTSRPGHPVRTMTVREQLENLAAHNAYHFGRIVLLRQLFGAWPPPSGGFSW